MTGHSGLEIRVRCDASVKSRFKAAASRILRSTSVDPTNLAVLDILLKVWDRADKQGIVETVLIEDVQRSRGIESYL